MSPRHRRPRPRGFRARFVAALDAKQVAAAVLALVCSAATWVHGVQQTKTVDERLDGGLAWVSTIESRTDSLARRADIVRLEARIAALERGKVAATAGRPADQAGSPAPGSDRPKFSLLRWLHLTRR